MIQADDGVRLYAESTGSGTPMLAAVDRGAWRQRDPRSLSASTTGMTS